MNRWTTVAVLLMVLLFAAGEMQSRERAAAMEARLQARIYTLTEVVHEQGREIRWLCANTDLLWMEAKRGKR